MAGETLSGNSSRGYESEANRAGSFGADTSIGITFETTRHRSATRRSSSASFLTSLWSQIPVVLTPLGLLTTDTNLLARINPNYSPAPVMMRALRTIYGAGEPLPLPLPSLGSARFVPSNANTPSSPHPAEMPSPYSPAVCSRLSLLRRRLHRHHCRHSPLCLLS